MICSITAPFPHCGKLAIAKGWCPAHYRRASQNDGDPLPGVPLQPRRVLLTRCRVSECGLSAEYATEQLCRRHYGVARSHDGNPLWVSVNEAADYLRQVLADPTAGCRLWPYSHDGDGYGMVSLDGVRHRVHVLACEYQWGAKPESHLVARHGPCRTPSCWAWEHLTWGSPAENFHDRWRDGTAPIGIQNGRAKLEDHQVCEIRAAYAAGSSTQRALASQFGVSQTLVGMIVRGEVWTHLL